MNKHTPMVIAAARSLVASHAAACEADPDDVWTFYSGDFIADAQKALDAAAAPDLLEALQVVTDLLDMALGVGLVLPSDANGPVAKARAAIAKATGEKQ